MFRFCTKKSVRDRLFGKVLSGHAAAHIIRLNVGTPYYDAWLESVVDLSKKREHDTNGLLRYAQSDVDKSMIAALLALGQAMLNRHALDPTWSEVLGWNLASETMAAIKRLAHDGEILRIDGPALETRLRFRHDRVRDWLLVTAALALEKTATLGDATLGDPALAEIVGALLVRMDAPDVLLQRVQIQAPLALFHALRVAPVGAASTRRIAETAMGWLRDPGHHGVATETLRWQAMAALQEVEGDYVLELIGLFKTDWPMGLLARLRNGDVEGGVALSARYQLSSVVHWTRSVLAAAVEYRATMVAALAALLRGDDNSVAKRRWALIEFAGVLGEPVLAPALESLWARDESRSDNLGVYLWAMARCATPETAARLLDPVCAAWGELPQERGNNGPSPRDELAAHTIRFGFEGAVPLGALGYFVERAKLPDLSWQIEYMLHAVDHPTAILFEVERGAERLRCSNDSYFFNDQARRHWEHGIERWGRPMSPTSRDVLLALWRNRKQDRHRRRSAFDFWAASRGADDLAILRAAASDPELGEPILRQRLLRGDTLAIPALVERLDGENGMRWWYYTRHVWSHALYEALDRALAREAAKPLSDENQQYEIGLNLTRPLMRLPPADAEPVLLRYWNKFGETMHFVQTALYVSTPKLLAKAAAVIAASPEPAKLFDHFTIHFGHRTTGEAGITREAQVCALAPYLGMLRAKDVRDLADACNENGWYALRRELIDPRLPGDVRAQPERFRNVLDQSLRHPHSSWIDREIDDLREADISWSALAGILRRWLASQPSKNALMVAKEAILHAGESSNVKLLETWPGVDEDLRAATIADLSFALRRRNRKRE